MPLIGNRRRLAFELIPVMPSWERRYAPERAAWAGVAIWVNGINLCQHVFPDSSEIEDYIFIPLAPVTDWLVNKFSTIEYEERAAFFPTTPRLHESAARWGHVPPPRGFSEDEWLEAREEWWSGHFIRAGADGARVPNLAFGRDDEMLVVTWRRPKFFGDDAPLMLSPEGDFSLSWAEGFSVLDDFVSQVAQWLREGDLSDLYPWVRQGHPLQISTSISLARAIELLTGRDLNVLETLFSAQDLNELLTSLRLGGSDQDPAASPQCQILRDLSPALPEDFGQLLIEVGSETEREDLPSLDSWQRL